MDEIKIGRTAALVTAGTYAIGSVVLAAGTMVDDADDDDALGTAIWFGWCAVIFIGTIAAVCAMYALFKATGGTNGALRRAALVVGALAVIGSFFTWAWLLWGPILSLAFLLAAFGLREVNQGVAGKPSVWDWVIPAAWPVGVLFTVVMWNTDWIEESTDGLDWGYTIGFLIGALLTGATMIVIADRLKTPVAITDAVPPPVSTNPPADSGALPPERIGPDED